MVDLVSKFISTDGDGRLICPRCGETYIHHEDVTVFNRGEDEKVLSRIVVSGPLACISRPVSRETDNPSRRRHGLSIRFWCEYCCPYESEDRIELTIAQHKGETDIIWRFTPITEPGAP